MMPSIPDWIRSVIKIKNKKKNKDILQELYNSGERHSGIIPYIQQIGDSPFNQTQVEAKLLLDDEGNHRIDYSDYRDKGNIDKIIVNSSHFKIKFVLTERKRGR